MDKLVVDRHKYKNLSREELLSIKKEELVDTVLQLQAHNLQLRNILAKKNGETTKSRFPKAGKQARHFDYSKWNTRKVLLRVAYLGGRYQGLTVQEHTAETIEAHLFRALHTGCLLHTREASNYHRSGRTDKGVSASGQVISIELRSCVSDEEQLIGDGGRSRELPYCRILNRLLPPDIRAIAWLPLPKGSIFSARFDCRQRTYKYWFPKGSLDLEAMRAGARLLAGSHDFRNLCRMDVANGVTAFTRRIHRVSLVSLPGDHSDGYSMHYLEVVANAFLWHQIRCMVGVLFLVGQGSEQPSVLSELLDVHANPRKPQYNMAIEAPLNLFKCSYDILKDYDDSIPPLEDVVENNDKVSSANYNNLNIKKRSEYCKKVELMDTNECNDVSESLEKVSCKAATEDTIETLKDLQPAKDHRDVASVEQKKNRDWWFVDLEDLELVIKNFQAQWSRVAIQASMIRDIVDGLQELYDSAQTKDSTEEVGQPRSHLHFPGQAAGLTLGVTPRVYQPLLKRNTCESLENRIEHFVRRKRLKKPPFQDLATADV